MSISSYILMEEEGGKYFGIFCRENGEPKTMGAMLLDHYSEREKLEKLMDFGDLVQLGKEIEPNPSIEHSFENPQEDVCVFYGRDKKCAFWGEATYYNLKDINIEVDPLVECTYIFTKNNEWKYFEYGELSKGLKLLKNYTPKKFRVIVKRPKEKAEIMLLRESDIEQLVGEYYECEYFPDKNGDMDLTYDTKKDALGIEQNIYFPDKNSPLCGIAIIAGYNDDLHAHKSLTKKQITQALKYIEENAI
jgi:hypothetical protein